MLQITSLQAATYYVNASTGSDSYSTAQAQNAGTPWLTINKAAGLVNAGDTVNVAAGTYNEYVNITRSGTLASPIRWYGAGETTIIDPSVVASSNWTLDSEYGTQVYKHTSLPFVPGGLFANGYWVMEHRNIEYRKSVFSASSSTLAQSTSPIQMTVTGAITRFGGVDTYIWDGLEAAWFASNSVVYLRFRDGSNPNSKTIRIMDNGQTISKTTGTTQYAHIWNKAPVMITASYNTFSGFYVRGGGTGSIVIQPLTGTVGSGNIIESNYVEHGWSGIVLTGGKSTSVVTENNIIRYNILNPKFYFSSQYPSGAYNYKTGGDHWKHWMIYWTGKYLGYWDPGTNTLSSGSITASQASGSTSVTASGDIFPSNITRDQLIYSGGFITYIAGRTSSNSVTTTTAPPLNIVNQTFVIKSYGDASGIEFHAAALEDIRGGNQFIYNTITNGGAGIRIDGGNTLTSLTPPTNNIIASNTFHRLASQGTFLNPGLDQTHVHDNLMKEISMPFRIQSINRNRSHPNSRFYIYRNRIWNLQDYGSLGYTHMYDKTSTFKTEVWFYNNSYEGGDGIGGESELTVSSYITSFPTAIQKFYYVNNIFSCNDPFQSYVLNNAGRISDNWIKVAISGPNVGFNTTPTGVFEWGGSTVSATVPDFLIDETSLAWNTGTNLSGLNLPDSKTITDGFTDMGWHELGTEDPDPEPPTDPPVSLSSLDSHIFEDGASTYLRVTRGNTTSGALSGTIAITGTAVSGVNYTAISTSWTIDDGQSYEDILIDPLSDGVKAGDLSIIFTLQAGAGYVVAGNPVTVYIVDTTQGTIIPRNPKRPGGFKRYRL